jgi:hypothetical protein
MAFGGAAVRPSELLIDQKIEAKIEPVLSELGARPYFPRPDDRSDFRQRPGAPPYGDINARFAKLEVGLRLWVDIPRETQIRLATDPDFAGLVHFNHVFFGESVQPAQGTLDFYHGGPGGPAVATSPPALQPESANRPPDIALLDTGLPANLNIIHPKVMNRVLSGGALWPLPSGELDPLDDPANIVLDTQAGHGLFICGLITKMTQVIQGMPPLEIQSCRVMHSDGVVDEAMLVNTLVGLAAAGPRVINLSLGGYSVDDELPVPLHNAISGLLSSGHVVVAAAGNAGGTPYSTRKFWPAAMAGVIAVGAYDSISGGATLWPKSNGADVYAPGVGVRSTFVEWPLPNQAGTPVFHKGATWSGTSFAAPLVAAAIAASLAGSNQTAAQWLGALTDAPASWPTTPGKNVAVAKKFVMTANPATWA